MSQLIPFPAEEQKQQEIKYPKFVWIMSETQHDFSSTWESLSFSAQSNFWMGTQPQMLPSEYLSELREWRLALLSSPQTCPPVLATIGSEPCCRTEKPLNLFSVLTLFQEPFSSRYLHGNHCAPLSSVRLFAVLMFFPLCSLFVSVS